MPSFKAYSVVASSSSGRVLFGAFGTLVAVRDLASGEEGQPISTTFDFGGTRIALSDEVGVVLAAAFNRHGVAGYRDETGREVWRRKDVKRVQRIALSRDGRLAYCGVDKSSLVCLDVATGRTVQRLRAASALHESPWDAVRFVDGTHPHLFDQHADGRRFVVERTTFAFLDAAFAPGLLCLSESGGPVRCLDLEKGTERWRYQPPGGSHVLHLGYRPEPGCLLGIEWPYERGGEKLLVGFAVSDGRVLWAHPVGSPVDCCFALGGTALVTTAGDVLDTVTAAPVPPAAADRAGARVARGPTRG